MLIASIRITMLSLLTFIALFHSAYASAQKSQCAAVFGTFRAAFNHNTAYSTEILERTPIKDQKNLGTCHLHSWAANLERSYFLRTGKTIELSASFLTAVHLFTNATQNLKADNIDQRIYLGSGALKSKSTIAQIGLIPAAIWKPSRDFQSNPMADQLETYFQNILTRTIIKKNAADTEERKAEILERAEKDILKIIESFVGPLPSSFEFESRKFTPQSFAQEFFPELWSPGIKLAVGSNRKKTTFQETSDTETLITTSIDHVEAAAIHLLDRGFQVYLAYEHQAAYVDMKSGVMSIAAFEFPDAARPLSRRDREAANLVRTGHHVQIVGYDRDPETGQVVKFKIKNSWGKKSGDAGYLHMYRDYFRAFATSIAFSADMNVPLPAATEN